MCTGHHVLSSGHWCVRVVAGCSLRSWTWWSRSRRRRRFASGWRAPLRATCGAARHSVTRCSCCDEGCYRWEGGWVGSGGQRQGAGGGGRAPSRATWGAARHSVTRCSCWDEGCYRWEGGRVGGGGQREGAGGGWRASSRATWGAARHSVTRCSCWDEGCYRWEGRRWNFGKLHLAFFIKVIKMIGKLKRCSQTLVSVANRRRRPLSPPVMMPIVTSVVTARHRRRSWRPRVLQHIARNVIDHDGQPKEILQSSFDLIGELVKFNVESFRVLDKILNTKERVSGNSHSFSTK